MANPQAPQQVEDKGSIGWAVLGFFIPLVGLILWLVWKDTRPNDSKQSRNGFLVSIALSVVIWIITLIISAVAASTMGS
jgi:heme/copper-type cytochrome/quinol oxidase subunit 2